MSHDVAQSVLTPLRFLERSAQVWARAARGGVRGDHVHLRRAPRADPPAGGRAEAARGRARRPRGDAAAERDRDARAALRGARHRRGAGAAQHAPHARRLRLHPRALRGGARVRRPRAGRAARRPAGDHRPRGADRGRRAGRPAAARGRARAALDQLHLRHHGPPEGRHDQPPRRLPALARRDPRGRPDGAQLLPVDAADVPLQRLGVHVGGDRGRRQARVPAEGGGGADLARAHVRGRDPSVRGADRADHDRVRRAGELARGARGGVRRRRAARAGAAREGRRSQPARDAPLRSHGDLRADRRLRLEPRLGRAARRGAGRAARAPGRRDDRLRADARGRRRHERRRPPTASRSARSACAATT